MKDYFTEGSSVVCVWGIGSKQNTCVYKVNSVSSHIWLKTKLRINSEILNLLVGERIAMHRWIVSDLWASARDVSSTALRSLSWACFSTRSRIIFSAASSSSCTECSSNASSPALKGRHKSAIKASNSKTMLMCVNTVLAVLASLVAAALAVLTGYKLIADSGNQNKTSDKALWLFLLSNAI